jgi:hypothetical protein
MAAAAISTSPDRAWYIACRWQEYAGEARANLLRGLAIVVLYGVQLVNFHVLKSSGIAFHRQATFLAVGWSLMVLAIFVAQKWRVFPAWLKYASTGADLALLTALAHAAGGPQSSVVAAYFLILGLAALRFSIRLIGAATIGAMLAYDLLVGLKDPTWFDAAHLTPLAEQLTMQATLGLTGIVLGQVIRHSRLLAEDFHRRMPAAP